MGQEVSGATPGTRPFGDAPGHGSVGSPFLRRRPMKNALAAVILLGALSGAGRGDDPKRLDAKAAAEDLQKLEGIWETDPKAAIQWKVTVALVRDDKRITGAQMAIEVGPTPKVRHATPLPPTALL